MLTSLFLNSGKFTAYKVYIFAQLEVASVARSKIDLILRLYPDHEIEWLQPNTTFSGASSRKHLTNPNYYRFLIPDCLPNYEKVIWIDVDTIIKGDLFDLFATDLSGFLLGAVRIGLTSASVNEVTRDDYFNAGVLLINNKLWIRERIIEKIKELTFSNNFKCPTQDPLNIVCFERTLHLNSAYNTLVFGNAKKENIQNYVSAHGYASLDKMIDCAIILHYVGEYKPWNYANCYGSEYWLEFYKRLPVAEFPISSSHKGLKRALLKTVTRLFSLCLPVRKWRRSFRDYLIQKIEL